MCQLSVSIYILVDTTEPTHQVRGFLRCGAKKPCFQHISILMLSSHVDALCNKGQINTEASPAVKGL